MKIAVSIICPVYRAEAYLDRCVASVRAQTLTDWELILVDDGSPDGSGRMCDGYAKEDPRIRVVHQRNMGVSCARQTGLDAARGDYAIHIDPDDWVEPGMYETLLGEARRCDADMVICDFREDSAHASRIVPQRPSSLEPPTVFRELFDTSLHGSCCNKLVRRSLFSRLGVSFPPGFTFMEDLYVNASLCLHDIRIAYVPVAPYHYVQAENAFSQGHRVSRSSAESLIRLTERFLPVWRARGMRDEELFYKYCCKDQALKSGLMTRRQARALYADSNGALLKDALRRVRTAPWRLPDLLGQYLPQTVCRGIRAALVRLALKRRNDT